MNKKPIGAERTDHKGYIVVKTNERWPNGVIKWEFKQRLIWKKANGEIPIDKKIIFLVFYKTNFKLENLAMADLKFMSEKTKSTRFQKGSKAWNKGTNYIAGGRSSTTQFKTGNKPHNTKYEGSERITKDGYTEVRLSCNNWVLKHRYIYETHNKIELETNQYVSFVDGNKQNFEIDNLQIVTRADMMLKNTIRQYPPELQEVIKVLNKVKKKVNDHLRKTNP